MTIGLCPTSPRITLSLTQIVHRVLVIVLIVCVWRRGCPMWGVSIEVSIDLARRSFLQRRLPRSAPSVCQAAEQSCAGHDILHFWELVTFVCFFSEPTVPYFAQSMLFSIALPRISPYDPVGLLSLAEGATRALQWKCVFPHLVAGGALWRTQRHLGQTRIEQLLVTRTIENVHFCKVL